MGALGTAASRCLPFGSYLVMTHQFLQVLAENLVSGHPVGSFLLKHWCTPSSNNPHHAWDRCAWLLSRSVPGHDTRTKQWIRRASFVSFHRFVHLQVVSFLSDYLWCIWTWYTHSADGLKSPILHTHLLQICYYECHVYE